MPGALRGASVRGNPMLAAARQMKVSMWLSVVTKNQQDASAWKVIGGAWNYFRVGRAGMVE